MHERHTSRIRYYTCLGDSVLQAARSPRHGSETSSIKADAVPRSVVLTTFIRLAAKRFRQHITVLLADALDAKLRAVWLAADCAAVEFRYCHTIGAYNDYDEDQHWDNTYSDNDVQRLCPSKPTSPQCSATMNYPEAVEDADVHEL